MDERPQVLGRRAPTALGVTGSARPTLKLLLERVAAKTDHRIWDKVTHERQRWDEMLDKHADLARRKDRFHLHTLASTRTSSSHRVAYIVLDTGLLALLSAILIRQTGSMPSSRSLCNTHVA